jgi:hypothetical protein
MRTLSHQFQSSRTEAVVGQHHWRNLRSDNSFHACDSLLGRGMIGIQVEHDNIARTGGEGSQNRILIRLQRDLKFPSQS